MNTEFSQDICEITKALIKFQKLCPKITKSKSSMYGMYADLASILETIRPALIECELVVTQMPDGKHGLTTIVSHSSGQFIRGYYEMEPLPVVVDKTTKERAVTPQSLGSVITYQRRYALGAALGFAAEEDTDARLKREKLAEKPKKSVADLLKSQATETKPTEEQPATDGISLAGVTSVAVDGPCTAEDVVAVKQMVADWDATKPGSAAEFAKRMAATGRKLAQFTIREIEALKQAIQLKSIESFFDHQLQKKN
jgi:hypothetical protein